jgi:hypothetical protein
MVGRSGGQALAERGFGVLRLLHELLARSRHGGWVAPPMPVFSVELEDELPGDDLEQVIGGLTRAYSALAPRPLPADFGDRYASTCTTGPECSRCR